MRSDSNAHQRFLESELLYHSHPGLLFSSPSSAKDDTCLFVNVPLDFKIWNFQYFFKKFWLHGPGPPCVKRWCKGPFMLFRMKCYRYSGMVFLETKRPKVDKFSPLNHLIICNWVPKRSNVHFLYSEDAMIQAKEAGRVSIEVVSSSFPSGWRCMIIVRWMIN